MNSVDRALLERVARQAMVDYGLVPEFPAAALRQAEDVREGIGAGKSLPDLRHLPWTSIDNPESQDLDQIEAIEHTARGTRLYVAIADVVSTVQAATSIDLHAAANTTSVYTGVQVFTMLPPRLSYGLTSLLPGQPRQAMVVEMRLSAPAYVREQAVYPAIVRNQAKLNYPAISAWLHGGPTPAELAANTTLAEQVRQQDRLAAELRRQRMSAGALDLDTAEELPVLGAKGEVIGLESRVQDRAGIIIEELMIAANQGVVRFLEEEQLPSVLRVVRRPAHWDQIVDFAAARGVALPDEPDSVALARFLDAMRQRRPHDFHEISLSIVKLIGRGEYVAHQPGQPAIGHFGLASRAYGHATAPNRRYPDMLMQRLLKGDKAALDFADLEAKARHCTTMEAQAEKVERRVRKSIAAALLSHRIGEVFEGVITKAVPNAVFVHISHPSVDGMILDCSRPVKVGDKVRARLISVDVEQSLIDFSLVRA